MKKVVGIYCGYVVGHYWDECSLNSGIGGSETWAIYVSAELQKRGYHVIVFNETETWHFSADGVEYVPFQMFNDRCQYQHFDYFITSRRTEEIDYNISCDNIFLMMHDLSLFNDDFKLDRIKKIGCLSNFHAENTKAIYPGVKFRKDNFFITCNGVNHDLYKETFQKENMMVWSSCRERGLPQFMDYVYPLIKEKVPDFKVIFADYNSIPYNDDRLEYKSCLSKKELAELQLRSKIWIYPATFYETFCITAVENAMAGNAIITTDIGALPDTLKGYKGIFGNNYLDFACNVDVESYKKTAEKIAEMAVILLQNESLRFNYAREAYNICKDYTWEKAADSWEQIFRMN